MAPSDHAALAVYDLDGVVTRKDSFTALLGEHLGRLPLRMMPATPAAVRWIRSGRRPDVRTDALRRISEVALAGLTDDGYSRLAARVGTRIGRDPSWVRPEVVERIRREHAEGTRIVIATASEHRLAEALLRAADVPYDLLSASRIEPGPAGLRVADHRIGARKAEALQQVGVDLGRATFATDSFSDLPTARLAARVVLVGASRRTRTRFAAAWIEAESL